MLFAIDIDDTIAGGPQAYKVYVEHHIQDLGLSISPHILETLTDYRSFLKLPDIANNLQKRLILVAFGIDSVPVQSNSLKVLPLSCWDNVASLKTIPSQIPPFSRHPYPLLH